MVEIFVVVPTQVFTCVLRRGKYQCLRLAPFELCQNWPAQSTSQSQMIGNAAPEVLFSRNPLTDHIYPPINVICQRVIWSVTILTIGGIRCGGGGGSHFLVFIFTLVTSGHLRLNRVRRSIALISAELKQDRNLFDKDNEQTEKASYCYICLTLEHSRSSFQ